MNASQTMILLTGVFIAPHIPRSFAQLLAVVSVVAGLLNAVVGSL